MRLSPIKGALKRLRVIEQDAAGLDRTYQRFGQIMFHWVPRECRQNSCHHRRMLLVAA